MWLLYISIFVASFAVGAGIVLLTRTKTQKKPRRFSLPRFSKWIVVWACSAATGMFVCDFVLCLRANEQMDPASIAAFCGFWSGEMAANAWIKIKERREKM